MRKHVAMHIHACCVFKSHACLGTSDLLSTMNKWSSQSNWSRNLHKLIYKFNMTLPVKMESLDLPVRWRNKHVMMPWPCLPFSSWVSCVFDKTCGQPLLAGKKSQMILLGNTCSDPFGATSKQPGATNTLCSQTM